MMKSSNIFIYFILLAVMINLPVNAQQKKERFNYLTGAKKGGEIDTLALETSKRIVGETAGLLEKEIDPEKYLVGPNDILMIGIVSANSREFRVKVSPEGKLIIPKVGAISLKNKTLAQADTMIREKISGVYKTNEIYISLDELRNFKVTVNGAVRKPSIVAATAADRVSEIIDKAGGLKEEASLRNILLLRRNIEKPLKVDLLGYFRCNDEDANPTVLGGDHIIVPPIDEENAIEIFGEVAQPDIYEYVEGDSLSTLVKLGLGFLSSALLDSVQISRIDPYGNIDKMIVDISSWKHLLHTQENLKNDISLQIGDRVFVRKKTNWVEPKTVVIKGEVKLPGYYDISKKDERLHDLLKRTGGFTEDASLDNAIFIRQKELDIKDPEMERLWSMNPNDMSRDELRYFQARKTEKRGVMAIDFRRVMEDATVADNVILEDDDSIYVPMKKEFINVQGRVNNPGLVVYEPDYTYLDYIRLAGGYGFRADEDETRVVKAQGQQYSAESMDYVIEPGDNILVPPQPDKTAYEIFTEVLTVTTQLVTIMGVVIALMRGF